MKWLLGILAAVVIVPVLAIAAWQQWGKTLPREPMVNCDHIPYLRAQIGDTLLTIPRKYVKQSGRVKGTSTTGDFYGRCQTENDPPVEFSFLTIETMSSDHPDYRGNNLSVFFPHAFIRFLDGADPRFTKYNPKITSISEDHFKIGEKSSIYTPIE